ncbi:MAG TPA: sigma-70 family RNA polymerase sigma factor [Planctomicrobium sp.]|nr:sigma-70 family RNA polymerase sigma factor [Planctomicrobium sp.]
MVYAGPHRLTPESFRSDQTDFVRLWTSAAPRVQVYILTMVMNWADADDILQDVGVTAWQKFSEYDRQRDFATWACGIARNKVLLFKRKENLKLVKSLELMERIEQVANSDSYSLECQYEALQMCLQRLSDSDRRLLTIQETSGISLKSVAIEAGRSVEAIYKAVQRIRARLFECVTRRLAERRDT